MSIDSVTVEVRKGRVPSFVAFCAVALVAALALAARPAAAAAVPAACAAPADWFAGIPPMPSAEPKTVCQFEQWAWQSLLALLETDAARPVPLYLTWPLPKDSVSSLYCPRACGPGSRPKVLLRGLCTGSPNAEVANATQQPGFAPLLSSSGAAVGSGELIDQDGRKVFVAARVSPEWVSFVERRQLFDRQVLEKANPLLSFRVGAFEIKTSWRSTAGMAPAEKAEYFTTQVCQVVDNKLAAVEEMALVGFHVTGASPFHPELLWATFEHARNAPDCAATPASGAWSFYDGRKDCRGGGCNLPDPVGSTVPMNVCRVAPYGGATPDVARQIAQLNRDVHARLPAGSALRHYDLVGTVWAADPLPAGAPVLNLQSPEGSPLLSNTTLETFKQGVSCFGCHNAQFPGELAADAGGSPAVLTTKSLYVSHVALFPVFFGALPCADVCTAPAGSAAETKR